MENTVLCVRWGDKYDDTYVKKLKEQLDKHLTVPFNIQHAWVIINIFNHI